MKQLLRVAESEGWNTALYNYTKVQVGKNGTVVEDQRTADWRYLLPLSSESVALVLGCGLGTVPVALSETCRKVYAVDSCWDKVAFLNIRKKQHKIDNLYPTYAHDTLSLPFSAGCFDLVSVRDMAQPLPFYKTVRRAHGLLKEGAIAHFSLGNRLAFQRLLCRGESGASPPLHTIFGYRRILKTEGFSDIQFYAVLPHHNGIPLFYIPLESSQAMEFFLRNIFPLFEMVTPESKQAFALEYMVAKIAVRLGLFFNLTSLAKIFVPGFCVIARKVV